MNANRQALIAKIAARTERGATCSFCGIDATDCTITFLTSDYNHCCPMCQQMGAGYSHKEKKR